MRRTPGVFVMAGMLLLLAAAGASGARRAGVVTLIAPRGDSLRTATPTFGIATSGFSMADQPVSLRLMVSTRPDFAVILVDTVIPGDNGALTLRDPLPELTTFYFRASALGPTGTQTFSAISGPHTTIAWLVLLSPNSPNGSTVNTRRPRFIWRSIEVVSPPGPWIYDIHITNVATRTATIVQGLVDTVYTPPFELDANTSYRWSVTARLQNGDSTRVSSFGSFVITSTSRPLLTLLYQNFPNPFPSEGRTSTCIWFDLSDRSTVLLDIRDLRGNLVRTLLQQSELPEVLPAGQYGRLTAEGTGCDARFSWDGRADDGRYVPRGLYLLRLRTDRGQSVKKVFFQGR